ncbi:ParB/RepB/Spo0J family partition protein [Ornithinimicrobium sp. LYQ92]|uniref:ParB/RepB/Spo0J family partition protein n=1 Tax=Serinicoccus sp. LYQ92 TaxID=3378798 RepID=UPI0038539F4A
MSQNKPSPEAATYVTLDPAALIVGQNVRATTAEDVQADAAFIASIRENGVLVPITAYTNEDGQPVVITGQRRTLAALVTATQVPTVLYPNKPENIDALRQQWDENERRAEMSEDDHARGIEQFSLLGLTAEQIAQATGEAPERVEAALSVVGTTQRRTIAEHGLTIQEAAALAEFEDDEEAVEELITAAQEGRFEHAAARVRWSKTYEQVSEQARAEQDAAGVAVVESYTYDGKTVKVSRLTDTEGNPLDPEAHAQCPGHAVSIDVRRGQDGSAVANVEPWCIGWRKHGHTDPYAARSATGEGQKMTEEQKQERKELIANNKAWDAAVEVRREWLATLATRKTPPAGAEALIAAYITGTGCYPRDPRRGDVAAVLNQPKMHQEVTATRTTKARMTMLALLQVIGQWEVEASRATWRNPSQWDQRIMAAFIAWGYTPGDVEQKIAPVKTRKPKA